MKFFFNYAIIHPVNLAGRPVHRKQSNRNEISLNLNDNYIPKATTLLILINILVFAVLELLGNTEDASFMASHGALSVSAVESGRQYVLFTAMFLHFGFLHLLNNMFVLFFVGRYLEQEIGPAAFTVVYIFGGLFGNVISLWRQYQSARISISAGASGAVFAVIGALFLLVLLRCGRLAQMRRQGVIMMVLLSVYQGYTAIGVDNAAHIAGLCAGIVISGIYYFAKKYRRQQE